MSFKMAMGGCKLLLLAMVVGTVFVQWGLPEGSKVAIHWNSKGEADQFSSAKSLWLLPVICLFVLGLLAIVPRLEKGAGPRLAESKSYAGICLAVFAFFAVFHFAILAVARGMEIPMIQVIGVALGALFAAMGWCLPGLHQNLYVGIRTPWTLKSAQSWERTHAVGGQLFGALGLGLIGATFLGLGDRLFVGVLLPGLFLVMIYLAAFSYRAAKSDSTNG